MDKIPLSFLILFSLVSCATNPGKPLGLGSVRGLLNCPGISLFNPFPCTRATEKNLNAPFVERVNDSLLVITLLNGGTKEFRDRAFNPNESIVNVVGYSAISVTSDSRYVTLYRQFWEGGASSIMDRQTGVEFELDGFPTFSPDGQWVATVDADLAATFSPNVLRIYRVLPSGLSLVYDAKPDGWGPEAWGAVDALWTSPTSLQYMHATFECFENRHKSFYTCERKTLRYDGTQWQ